MRILLYLLKSIVLNREQYRERSNRNSTTDKWLVLKAFFIVFPSNRFGVNYCGEQKESLMDYN